MEPKPDFPEKALGKEPHRSVCSLKREEVPYRGKEVISF
jgi:hypothetical protein